MLDMNALIQQINPHDITKEYCKNFLQENGRSLTNGEKKILERHIRTFQKNDGDTVLKAIIIYALFFPAEAMEHARQKGIFSYAKGWPHTTYCLQQLEPLLEILDIPEDERCFIRQKLQCSWLKSFYETTEKRIKKAIQAHYRKRIRNKVGLQKIETNLIVELLAYINYYFRNKNNEGFTSQTGRNKLSQYTIEDLTEAVSYLIYLCHEEDWPVSEKHLWMDPDYLMGNEIEALIQLACQRNFMQDWEIQADYMRYSYASTKNQLTIHDPGALLEKSLAIGFIRTAWSEEVLTGKVFEQNPNSLAWSACRFAENAGPVTFHWREDASFYKRYQMKIPMPLLEPYIPKDFDHPALYSEEQSQLEFAANERMLTVEQFCEQPITKHCTFLDLLLFKRFFTLLVYTYSWLCRHENNPRKVIVSIVPVMPKLQLLNITSRFVGSFQKAEELIEHFTWDGKEKLDLQYTPIIKISEQRYYISLDVLSSSNVLRNSILLERMRHNKIVNTDGQNDALETFCKEAFQRLSSQYKTRSNIEFQYHERDGEIDFLAWSDQNLYVFECKNTIFPASVHETRTTYDHIQKASQQLDLAIAAMGDATFQKKYFPGWGIPLKNYTIYTCILLGNRLFAAPNGMRHPVRHAHDLGFVLNDGIFQSEFGEWSCWAEKDFMDKDLVHFLSDEDSFLNCFTDAMSPYEHSFHCQGKSIKMRTYSLDVRILVQNLDSSLRLLSTNPETRKSLESSQI